MRAVTESSFIISETNHEHFLYKNVDIKFSAHDEFLE
jgi:hypothetical protein